MKASSWMANASEPVSKTNVWISSFLEKQRGPIDIIDSLMATSASSFVVAMMLVKSMLPKTPSRHEIKLFWSSMDIPVNPKKADPSTNSTDAGSLMRRSCQQSANAFASTRLSCDGLSNAMSRRDRQDWKQLRSMQVTLLGIVIFVKAEHRNASGAIVLTRPANFTSRTADTAKQPWPTVVTLSPITTPDSCVTTR
jgi:hypothetical protein